MARILITGASGLLGGNLALLAAKEHEVVGVYQDHAIELPGVGMVQADLAVPGAASAILREAAPQWIVNCAAAANVDACERDPEGAYRANESLARQVAEAAQEVGARLLHISTDAVFDGRGGPYRESDLAEPLSVYGASKWAGERAVSSAYPEALIVRTNFYGWNLRAKNNLAEWFLQKLEAGERCLGFTDVFFSPLYVEQLGGFLLDLLEDYPAGLLHLPAGECVSKFEFGRRLAGVFDLDGSLIQPGSVDDAGMPAQRAKQLCLEGGRAAELLGALPDLDSGLEAFRRDRAHRTAIRERAEAAHERT